MITVVSRYRFKLELVWIHGLGSDLNLTIEVLVRKILALGTRYSESDRKPKEVSR